MSTESKIPEEFTFTWRIENYSFWDHSPRQCCDSRVFSVESLGKREWQLLFYPRGKYFGDDYIQCHLFGAENDEGDEEIILNEKLDIISADGEILESKKREKVVCTRSMYSLHLTVSMKIEDLVKKMENCEDDTLIIRCCIGRNERKKRKPVRYELKTKIDVDRCLFKWNVSNFNSEDWVESKKFLFPRISHFEITLRAPKDALLIKIQKPKDHHLLSRIAICRVSLLDVEGVERHSKKYTHLFDIKDVFDDTLTWEFPSFITKTQLNSEGQTFLKNGTFTFMCEFSISIARTYSEISPLHSEIWTFILDTSSPVNVYLPMDTTSNLKEDLRSMFTSKKHSDVKLRAGHDIFPAHKSLLSARSPVFSAMFDQDMLESRTGIVDILDMDAVTLNTFLSFLYTGTVDKMDYEVTLKLMLAADKYQVESLKEKCAAFLTSDLSDGNACEVLAIADMVGHKLFKECVQDYIKSRAKKILPHRGWSQWMEKNVRLASEILSKLSVEFGSLEDEPSVRYGYGISSPVNVDPSMDDTFSSLKENFRSIFISKKLSDVKLQVGGDIFPAHKAILAGRSPVFSVMFDQDMLESQTGIVDIPDMDAEILNTFLSFLYTGTVDKMDYEVTLKLMLAADKYQVESLKEKCAAFLTSNLSDGNALEVLVIADMVEDKLLKEFVQDYIKTNAAKILPSPEWSQWIERNTRLAIEILSKMSVEFGSLANDELVTQEE